MEAQFNKGDFHGAELMDSIVRVPKPLHKTKVCFVDTTEDILKFY